MLFEPLVLRLHTDFMSADSVSGRDAASLGRCLRSSAARRPAEDMCLGSGQLLLLMRCKLEAWLALQQ